MENQNTNPVETIPAGSEPEMKVGEVCTNCGAPLEEGQEFCPKCGTPRKKKPVCGKCGAELVEGQEFCPKCGQKVGLAVDAGVASKIDQFNAGVEKKKSNKKLIPIIAAVAVIVVIIAAVLLKGPSVDEIVLAEDSIELKVDASQSVSYTISPAKASDAKVTWKSSNESVATVNENGKITAEGDGSCTITVTAGGKSDTLTVTVKSGPDFKALYDQYCESTWADVGSDGSYLMLDTNPYDRDDDGLAYPAAYSAMSDVHKALGLPDSLLAEFGETTGADGKQSQDFPNQGVTVSWKYHPDKGLEVTYKAY